VEQFENGTLTRIPGAFHDLEIPNPPKTLGRPSISQRYSVRYPSLNPLLYALFLNTLLPAGGTSATFFPAAPTPTPLFCAVVFAAAGGLPAFLITVVAFDVVETSLLLLAILASATACVAPAPRLALVAAGFEAAAVGFVVFLPAPAFARVALGFSTTMFARMAVAAMAADLAGESCLDGERCLDGESCFEGDIGFKGEAGRERCDF